MNFYSNKQPNLIGPVMKSTITTIVKQPNINNTVSDKVSTYLAQLYQDYIIDNKITVFFILIVFICLVYRYYNKPKPTKEKFDTDKNLLKEIQEYQTEKIRYDNPPAMNPTSSIADDDDIIHYPPEELPINLPSGMTYSRDIYNTKINPNPLNHTNYNHNNVYQYPSRQYSMGTYNTYKNAQDTDIPNPYLWSNNFNTTSGNFVGQMTDKNFQNTIDYQSLLDTNESQLTHNLTYGSTYNGNNINFPFALD